MPEFTDVEREVGTYRSRFVGLEEDYKITPKATGIEESRWRWVFQNTDPRDSDPVIDTIASPGFKPRSNGLKFLTGMLGRAPRVGDKTEDLIGQEFDVDWGPNLNGRNTIVNVRKVTPVAPQNVTDLKTATDKAEKQHAMQEGGHTVAAETATFRETEVEVTDPDALPF